MNPHAQILSLARAGNPVRAWERFCALGLGEASTDAKALTLKGRLLKDLGKRAAGDERARLFREASQAYLAANELRPDTYPLINAATLALLSQDARQAKELARRVLGLIEADPGEGETPYWREATRAEALLLLGMRAEAEAALASGIARLPRAWEDHAATIGQFERIIAAQGGDQAWLDAFRPASSVHFSGLIGLDPDDPQLAEALKTQIADLSPGFAFGALAAGADIMIAETMLEAGALLHVVLPVARDRFRSVSVEPYGAQWAARFDALIDQAETVDELWDVSEDLNKWLGPLVEAGNLAAMGQTLRRAETLRSRAHAMAVMATGEADRSHIALWEHANLPVHRLETPRVSGLKPTGSTVCQPTTPAILAVKGATATQLRNCGLEMSVESETINLSGPILACLAAARDVHKTHPDATAGIWAIPVSNDNAREVEGHFGAHLAHSAAPGQLYADQRTAMIAKALDPAIRVEEMGEVGTLEGPLTVFAIATS